VDGVQKKEGKKSKGNHWMRRSTFSHQEQKQTKGKPFVASQVMSGGRKEEENGRPDQERRWKKKLLIEAAPLAFPTDPPRSAEKGDCVRAGGSMMDPENWALDEETSEGFKGA